MKIVLATLFLAIVNSACASPYPRVDKDIATYDKVVAKLKSDFSSQPRDPTNKIWVQEKIDNMMEVDQYMRKFWDTPFINSYSADGKSRKG